MLSKTICLDLSLKCGYWKNKAKHRLDYKTFRRPERERHLSMIQGETFHADARTYSQLVLNEEMETYEKPRADEAKARLARKPKAVRLVFV